MDHSPRSRRPVVPTGDQCGEEEPSRLGRRLRARGRRSVVPRWPKSWSWGAPASSAWSTPASSSPASGPRPTPRTGSLRRSPHSCPSRTMGIGAVILNAVAGSSDLPRDAVVRRALTTALRVPLVSSLGITTTGIVLGLPGLWPALPGARLVDGGGATATICLLVYAAALPLSIGQRAVVGMGRAATQAISQGAVSPALSCLLVLVIVARLEAGSAVPVPSCLANALVSIICVAVAWRATRPSLREAVRDVPRLRSALRQGACARTRRVALLACTGLRRWRAPSRGPHGRVDTVGSRRPVRRWSAPWRCLLPTCSTSSSKRPRGCVGRSWAAGGSGSRWWVVRVWG